MWILGLKRLSCAVSVFLFHWLGKDAIWSKKKWYNLGINHTAESQPDCTDRQ